MAEPSSSSQLPLATASAPPAIGGPPPTRSGSSKTARAASALKSGVVYGVSTALSGVVSVTPHLAGAVDIIVVEQPDGSFKSSPFYVRFGKYTHLRNKDRSVQISINGQVAPFQMQLGEYGQAYFHCDGPESGVPVDEVEDEERLLAGMMSPSSGFSSEGEGEDEAGVNGLLAPLPSGGIDALQQQSQLERSTGVTSTSQRGVVAGGSPTAGAATRRRRGSHDTKPGAAAQGTAAALQRGGSGTASLGGAGNTLGASPTTPDNSGVPLVNLPSLEEGAPVGLSTSIPHRAVELATSDGPPVAEKQQPAGGTPAAVHVLGFPSPSTLRTKQIAAAAGAVGSGFASLHVPGSAPSGLSPVVLGQVGDEEGPATPLSLGAATRGAGSVGATPTCVSLLSSSLKGQDSDTAHVQDENAAAKLSQLGQADHAAVSAVSAAVAAADQQGPGEDPLSGEQPEGMGFMSGLNVRTTQAAVPGASASTSSQTGHVQCGTGAKPHGNGMLAAGVDGGAAAPRGSSCTGTSSNRSSMEEDGSTEAEEASGPPTSIIVDGGAVAVPLAGTSAPNAFLADAAHRELEGVTPPLSARGDAAHGPRVFNPLAPTLSGKPAPGPHGAHALAGLELSLCGALLRPGSTGFPEASQLFDAHRVGPAEFARKGGEIVSSPELMVRVDGVIYPWAAAAPMVLGMAAFGATWHQLLPVNTPIWGPLNAVEGLQRMASSGSAGGADISAGGGAVSGIAGFVGAVGEGAEHGAKKAGAGATVAASSSWRLWPFGGWQGRDRSVGGPPPTRTPTATPAGTSPPTGSSMDLAAAARARLPGLRGKEGSGEQLVRGSSSGLVVSPRSASAMPALATQTTNTTLSEANSSQHGVGSRSYRQKLALSMVRKTLSPSSEQLAKLKLREGQNTIKFKVGTSTELVAYIYFYSWTTKLVISDIDGTITKSDVLGHLLPAMGWDWSHAGITRLFTDIMRNSYQVMYLSSRSISQASITRDYINTLVQGGHRMPVGPVIISPHGLLPSLYREMILRRPHEFKIATLQDIRNLFPSDWNPFYAGFGNRDTDEISYREVGVPPSRIFIINPKGELRKATMAIQSSTWNTLSAINDLVHSIFPPITRIRPRSALPPAPEELTAVNGPGGGASAGASVAASGRGGTGAGASSVPASTQALAKSSSNASAAAAGVGAAEGCEESNGAAGAVPGTRAGAAATAAALEGTLTPGTVSAGMFGATLSVPHVQPQELYTRDALSLLSSMAAAEQFNDLSFWAPSPSAAMAGTDIDELERLMVVKAPPPPSRTTSSGRRHEFATTLNSISAPLSPDDFSREDRMDSTGRTSSDFLSTYNPFAM